MVLGVLTGWLERREREAVAYLIEEDRLLRRQLGTGRPRLTDDDRRRLAARAYRVDRAALQEIATIATPDTLLRWHRQLIARKWSYSGRPGRRGVLLAIRRLVVRMAMRQAADRRPSGPPSDSARHSTVGHQSRIGPSDLRATACRSRAREEMLERLAAMQSRNRVRDHRSDVNNLEMSRERARELHAVGSDQLSDRQRP